MKIVKITLAVILTIFLLYIARNNAMNQPRLYSYTENGFSFEYLSVPKGMEKSQSAVTIKIEGIKDSTLTPVFRRIKFNQDKSTDIRRYGIHPLQPIDTSDNLYSYTLQTGPRGDKTYYYFAVQDASGGIRAKLTMPDGEPFVFKYIGEVPEYILYSHIILIFATFFFIALAAANSVSLISGGTTTGPVAKYIFWAVILSFLGGYPFGFAMNWYAFNGFWEGVPFGTDATDNKTQLWFAYLVFALLSMLGSLRGKPEKDLFQPKIIGWLGISSFLVTIVIFLIPHSIQFSPELTKIVCYSYLSVLAAIYLTSLALKKFRKK